MTPSIDIRRLLPADLAAMRGVLSMFADAFEDAESYFGEPPDDAYLAGLLRDERFFCLAAAAGSRIVGALAGYELRKFEKARSEFYIYDLAVDAEHRRQGIATRLIEALQALAAERQVHVIFVQAEHGDDAAVALYTKLGTGADVMQFDIAPARRGG